MSLYLTDLGWIKSFDDFTEEQKIVMLALSHHKYKWRGRVGLLKATQMDTKTLDRTLSSLIIDDYVRPTFSKRRNIVFGIRERVG